MKGYYDLIDTLRTELEASPFINAVTEGNLFNIDLSKQSIFPMCHIMVNNVSILPNVFKANISLIAMDIVDFSKDATTDVFKGNTNEQDILNTQLIVLARVIANITNGSLYSSNFQLEGEPSCEPFRDRFENVLAGWTCTLDILFPNEMSIC